MEHNEERQITLCVFPHLREVVVIDGRPDVPNVMKIGVDEILDDSFLDDIRDSFDKIVDVDNMVLADLASIPSQVESSIKVNVIRRIILIESESGDDLRVGMLGVMFFSDEMMWKDPDRWRDSLASLFSERLPPADLNNLLNSLTKMMEEERQSQSSAQSLEATRGTTRTSIPSVSEIVKGADGYETVWGQGGG